MRSALLTTLLLATGVHAQATKGSTERDLVARFGEEVEAALNERNVEAMKSLIDIRGLALRTADFLGFRGTEQADFVRGFTNSEATQMGEVLVQNVDAGQGQAKFLRVTAGDPGRALVRLDLGQNGTEYLEFLVDTKAKKPRAIDWFRLSSGELMSVTVGTLGQLYTSDDPGLLGRLFGTKTVGRDAIAKLRQVGVLQRQQKYSEALMLMKELPEPVASSRLMLSRQAALAMFARQNDEYLRVLARLAEKYSQEPSTAFMLIDHYYSQGNLPKTLECIDTMEKRVGMDGVTRQLRASTYLMAGDAKSSLKFADEAIRVEPDYLYAYDSRATALVSLGRFDDAVAQYRDVEKRFGLQFTREQFTSDPQYATLVASPAFKAWFGK
jgi:tetratricopeptide (TPR) repeat protein